AKERARHLAGRSVAAKTGCSWPSALGSAGLAGFAHGASGITWALAHLETATGEPMDREIEGGLAYERSLYLNADGNWRDLRRWRVDAWKPGTPPPTSMAWCHGAPGIGLAR